MCGGARVIRSRGGSCIIDPFGEILAGPNFERETTPAAEIDRQAIARSKFDFDVTGHYARPDVFRLAVDERRKSPVPPCPTLPSRQAAKKGRRARNCLCVARNRVLRWRPGTA
ncbi:MAG: hypothetical protein EOP82_21150 [Variovorax sp.]|nr:MAG: hypothetical protein EOP82_21150 [Variovorax sp.]